MSNVANIAEATIKRAAALPNTEGANNVFKVLHGFYGNLFLSKFATGQERGGEDFGVVSARQIWAHALRDTPPHAVKSALGQCLDKHPEFPPSLPQFVALCRANTPRETFAPATPAIGMSQALRSQYAARARAINEKYRQKAVDRKTGYVELPQSLDGLKQAIANAFAAAGGDEAAELRRLDAMFAKGATA